MKKMFVLMLASMLCLLLIACSNSDSSNTDANENQDSASVAAEEAAKEAATVDAAAAESEPSEKAELMDIETAYGTLSYPAEWKDSLVTNESQDDDGLLSVTFSAKLDEQEYSLFKIMICGEEGDSVGTIKDAEGTVRNVFVELFELSDLSDLSEDAQNQLYAMQEGVNTLISELD